MREGTYQRSGADTELGEVDAGGAVSGRDDGVAVDEGAAAEVTAVRGEGDDVGELAALGGDTADDVRSLVELVDLASGPLKLRWEGEFGQGCHDECSDDKDALHGAVEVEVEVARMVYRIVCLDEKVGWWFV